MSCMIFTVEEYVLLRHVISLKVICENVKFQTAIFAIMFVILNIHACKLFKTYLMMFKPKAIGK